MQSTLHPTLVAAALCAAFIGTAHAQTKGGGGSTTANSSGVIVIDQAKAEAGGVSTGDAAGFPITISQPGSYRLMSNLVVTNMATSAVVITSPGVTLDLNGFEIRGPNTCTGGNGSLNCPSLTLPLQAVRGHGIDVAVNGEEPASVLIENGAVRGFAGHGLHASGQFYNYSVQRLRVSHNGIYGINFAAKVSDAIVDRNAMGGVNSSALVMHSLVMFNRGLGLNASVSRMTSQWNNNGTYTSSYE